jgi:glycerophosphoryl diester phosphodiesterase
VKKLWIPIVVLALHLQKCKKDPDLFAISNLENNKVKAFGHGGMGIRSLWPIDSYESLQNAMTSGGDGSEMDLQMSSDSVLFLYHAADLSESTHCSGKLNDFVAADLNCEYKSLAHNGIKICTLSRFLDNLPADTTLMLTFECKLDQLHPQQLKTFANALLKVIDHYRLQNRLLIESTNPSFLKGLQERAPHLKLFFYHDVVDYTLQTADTMNLFGVTLNMDLVSLADVQEAHRRGLRVSLFNQQTKSDNVKCLKLSPDFMQTDQLAHLIKILKK